MAKRMVIAIGGNSLIKDRRHQDVRSQYIAARETTEHVASLVEDGWEVVIGHGNGPQSASSCNAWNSPRTSCTGYRSTCAVPTQGAIGYALVQNLQNRLRRDGLGTPVVAVVTQVEVGRDDKAFEHPSKPVGPFMDTAEAARRREQDGWDVAEDANRGWRRVVASPRPRRIVELDAIRTLVDSGVIVVAVGGGGIPVVADLAGDLHGVEAVIDKDLACALLARELGAELFLITTAVERVALHFGSPQQLWVDHLTLDEARGHLAEGIHFAEGSMAPKMQAVVEYLEAGGTRAIITDPAHAEQALRGEAGTSITVH